MGGEWVRELTASAQREAPLVLHISSVIWLWRELEKGIPAPTTWFSPDKLYKAEKIPSDLPAADALDSGPGCAGVGVLHLPGATHIPLPDLPIHSPVHGHLSPTPGTSGTFWNLLLQVLVAEGRCLAVSVGGE